MPPVGQATMGDYLAQKTRVFDFFDKIDDSSDDDFDHGFQASKEAMTRVKTKAVRAPPLPPKANQCNLSRSVSASTLAFEPSSAKQSDSAVPSSTLPQNEVISKPNLPAALRKSFSASGIPTPTSSEFAKITGKRKRESSIKTVPEDRQIFKGLHFYFFPNNDAAPARKMRITKAREFGAEWHREWNSSITHVVVDRNLTYQQLLDWLKFDRISGDVVVVAESYPSECISYGILLDTTQVRFAVKGFTPATQSKLPMDSGESDTSLQLKPMGKGSAVRQAETPPRAAESLADASLKGADIGDDIQAERLPGSLEPADINSSEELDEAIDKARALGKVTLEDEEDEEISPGSPGGADTSDEEQRGGSIMVAERKNKNKIPSNKFQCMNKNTGPKPDNPNNATIEILQQMADYYGQTGDEWRVRAYRKAISTLRNHTHRVSTKEEAGTLPNIGPRLAEKIEEITFTNRLRRLESAKGEPADQLLRTFMGVYGVGIKQASDWVNQGYKTLDELLQKATLADNQRIGIEHYEDFNSRIPRAEVQKHGDFVRHALRTIDPSFEVIIGGSFRRGSEDSGDIDCIVTRPDTGAAHLRNVVLGQLVPQLTEQGFLVANLAMTSRDDGSKWHGASCLPGAKTWRRMDLLLVPSDEIGAALIYFTGNDIFNRSLRLLASTKGMRLNQRGLYRDVMRGKGRVKLTEGSLVAAKDEKKIFEALGVPWRPPEHRIC